MQSGLMLWQGAFASSVLERLSHTGTGRFQPGLPKLAGWPNLAEGAQQAEHGQVLAVFVLSSSLNCDRDSEIYSYRAC